MIPAITGILGILGLVFLMIHWMSRSRNLQAHKVAYNEIARCLAEGGYQVLSNALHKGIKHPDPERIKKWLLAKTNSNLGFYGFLTKLDGGSRQSLEHDEIMTLFSDDYRKILKDLERQYPGAQFKFSLSLDSSQFHENQLLKDPKEKIVELRLTSSCSYKGTVKGVRGTRKIAVYNLLSPIISKFTYYHKGNSGDSYNRFGSNIYGRPVILPDGSLKYQEYIAPLVLINGPLEKKPDFVPDSILLEAHGSQSAQSSFDYLSDSYQIEKSRKEILRRGFLYFGPDAGAPNIFNLTPGLDPDGYGEYFTMFNPAFGDGPRTYPAVQFLNIPEAFKVPISVLNRMVPSAGIPDFYTNGKADIYSLYEGFYESDPTNSYTPNPLRGGQIKMGYSEKSSIIHPFGTHKMPSRAYTVGSAYRAIAKISSMGIDRDDSSADESNQGRCLGFAPPRRDATAAFLHQVDEAGFLDPQPGYTFDPIRSTLDNRNYANDCNEPSLIQLPSDFNYPFLFPTYESYRAHMSDVILIPMNHLIDFPHYSHRVIPPPGHDSFSKFMFAPHEPESLLEIEAPFLEKWVIPPGPLHPKGSVYLEGNVDSFAPDQLLQLRNYIHVKNMDEMIELGLLQKVGNEYLLNTRGYQILLESDLILDKPILITDDTNLIVRGECVLPPIQSSFYTQISCKNIQLAGDPRSSNPAVYRAFLNARGSISKVDPNLGLNIVGGIAMNNLNQTFFKAPSIVQYNIFYSPLENNRDYFYRILMDDRTLAWSIDI